MAIQLNKLAFVGILAVSFLAAPSVDAWGGRGAKRIEKMSEELNLSSEQREALAKIQKQNQDVMQSKRQAMKDARRDLEQALQGPADSAELRKKFQALQKLQDEYASARFETVLAIREILTPEQRATFKAPSEDRRGPHSRRGFMRHGGPRKGADPGPGDGPGIGPGIGEE